MPHKATRPKKGDPLTPRELQILQMLATGITNGKVGQRLYLTEDTVKTYVARILVKLDCLNRTQAVVVGISTGLVPLAAGSRPVIEAVQVPA